MPNQYFPRGYYGYPYPQQNMFQGAPDGYSQYPFMSPGLPPMQPRPYAQNGPYMDPNAYASQQFDPYPQYGYNAQRPYEMSQMMPNTVGMQPFGMMPQIQPSYATPMMQPPYYGFDFQQPYMPTYPVPAFDPQMAQFANPANQYWADYAAAAYPTVNPGATSAYPAAYPDPNSSSTGGTNIEHKRHKRARARKQARENARQARRTENNTDAEQKARAAKQQQEEELRQQAALREARLAQRKQQAAQQAAQEAAQKEAIRQELARRSALKQQAAQQAAMQVSQQARIQQAENKAKAVNAINAANAAAAKAHETNPTAAAAASIAAFHKAAKSVNEINLKEVETALNPKPDSSVDLEDLGINFVSKLNNEVPADTDTPTQIEETVKTEETVLSENNDAETPVAKKADDTEEVNDPEKALASPNEDDVVIVESTEVSEAATEKDAQPKDEQLAAQTSVIEKDVKDKKDEQPKEPVKTDAQGKNESNVKQSSDSAAKTNKPPLSPIAIIGLVFGIVAVVMAAMAPMFNFLGYAALVVGALALILSIVSLFTMKNNQKGGKPAGILGIICGIAAVALAVTLHFLMPVTGSEDSTSPDEVIFGITDLDSSSNASSAIDNGSGDSGFNPTGVDTSNTTDSTTDGSSSSGTSGTINNGTTTVPGSMSSMDVTPIGTHKDLAVGTSVEYTNGLTIKVDSIKTGLTNSAGKQIVCVSVTYKNDGSGILDYNSFDWKVEDSSGTLRTYTIYPGGNNELNSGELSIGASVTGNLYFEGPIKKIIYEANYWNSDSNASWKA